MHGHPKAPKCLETTTLKKQEKLIGLLRRKPCSSGENPRAHTHHCSHASRITHHVHWYWEYYPNIRLRYIGHPCHSGDFRRTPKPKPSSKRNRNLAAVWGLKVMEES